MPKRALAKVLGIFAPTDEQLMWRVQANDDAVAFAELIARWEAPIKRLCTRMLGDEHRADDATQLAFARAHSRRQDYTGSGRFSTWLWRVALNLCYDELRRIKRRNELSLDDETGPVRLADLPSEQLSPSEELGRSEVARTVQRALALLPEHCRTVVILRHYENLKFREIAEVLDIPEGTVKSRMAEALNKLSHYLRNSTNEETNLWNPKNTRMLV